ncbi:hypothetical protein CTI12_AA410490 [Artemisia annua]|uniref:Reverse transcriptase RNase H-like domain-containing protein n=1 Tax=Artemisia annua TaxID=35608 RepID=A0A2U1M797_ARTAN|nr:hypothetical protein CTI12_AA410490 [Artemisia annua]
MVIRKEIGELTEAGILRRVENPPWVTIPINPTKGWRMEIRVKENKSKARSKNVLLRHRERMVERTSTRRTEDQGQRENYLEGTYGRVTMENSGSERQARSIKRIFIKRHQQNTPSMDNGSRNSLPTMEGLHGNPVNDYTSSQRETNMQIPIYFISKALPEAERSYAESEKLVLAMVYATRYLRRYFKDHPIRVLTDKPIEWTSLKPDRSKRMVKWATELEEYDIEYGIEGPFEGHTDEPEEVDETNMSSNKKTLEAKRGEKHQVDDLWMRKTSHSKKKGKRLVEPSFESGVEQQASTK